MFSRQPDEHGSIELRLELTETVVPAGTSVEVRAVAACAHGCDLSDLELRLLDQGGQSITELRPTEFDGEAYSSEAIQLPVPDEPGEHTWRLESGDLTWRGARHPATAAEVTFQVSAHATQLNIWKVPPSVNLGEEFSLLVGAKCREGCDLAGSEIEIRDAAGGLKATVRLGEETWPGTTGLYYAEASLTTPDAPGYATWTATLNASSVPGPAHERGAQQTGLTFVEDATIPVKVKVADKEKGSPVVKATVVAHPFRTVTDENGEAELTLPPGKHRLMVSGYQYVPHRQEIELTEASLEIAVELQWEDEMEMYETHY